jgi:hypothetical protein
MSIVLYARTVPDFRHGLLETTNVMWDDPGLPDFGPACAGVEYGGGAMK